ncbi:hypothetical protein HAX54_046944 [Datura stramonium]|uniref:DUF547 domain-containing protein n=1 Tax=Datura stramonium TaxID=4076 RepID=A0ABS8RPX7_DATST|nr:hypothetical protein [Datura stramonium]
MKPMIETTHKCVKKKSSLSDRNNPTKQAKKVLEAVYSTGAKSAVSVGQWNSVAALIYAPECFSWGHGNDCNEQKKQSSSAEIQSSLTQEKETNSIAEDKFNESGVNRSHSSLSQRSALFGQSFPPEETLGKTLRVIPNHIHDGGLKEFSGPYSTMVEVQFVYRDTQKLGCILEPMLQNFRSLISRLEQIDPRKLTWRREDGILITVYNALVMHVRYDTELYPGMSNVQARTVASCYFSSKGKFKMGDERQTYAIEHPEPLLHFALSSGNHSIPLVRVYTPKRVFQELEVAKEDYIRATFGVKKDQKIVLPKVVESFAKDSSLASCWCDGDGPAIHWILLEGALRRFHRERAARTLNGFHITSLSATHISTATCGGGRSPSSKHELKAAKVDVAQCVKRLVALARMTLHFRGPTPTSALALLCAFKNSWAALAGDRQ